MIASFVLAYPKKKTFTTEARRHGEDRKYLVTFDL